MSSEDESGWNVFCDKHYEEAFNYIKHKFKTKLVSILDYEPCGDEEDMLCSYPHCENKPTKEIIWITKW